MKKELKIYLASPRGFCAGVKRAIEIVEKSISKFGAPVYVRHEIVHNKQVVEELKEKGAIFVDELSDVDDVDSGFFRIVALTIRTYWDSSNNVFLIIFDNFSWRAFSIFSSWSIVSLSLPWTKQYINDKHTAKDIFIKRLLKFMHYSW